MSGFALRSEGESRVLTSQATVHGLPSSEASYFRLRASAHRAVAKRSAPVVASVHYQFAAAYLAAADAAEKGRKVDFDGEHRALPLGAN